MRECVLQEVSSLRERLKITVESEPAGAAYKPVRSFKEAGFPANVLAACRCAVCLLCARPAAHF